MSPIDTPRSPWGVTSAPAAGPAGALPSEPPIGETAAAPPANSDGLAPGALTGEFFGRRGALFWLALKTSILTVLTLGFYRFWMKTRLRRWYWSAIRIGGIPLEYVGDPVEKLLGFLIAVVILAFYIGVVNLMLMFASFALFQGNFAAYLLSFLGVIPLWFYAQYRARRYVLARTRWRGLRFGLEPAAWGYAWRSLWYWGLTLVSAGLLWPVMTFQLEKYKTDRTSWGTATLTQGGRWTLLFGSAKWVYIGIFTSGVAAVISAAGSPAGAILPGFAASILVPFGLVYYRVDSLRRLTEAKEMNGITLRLRPSSWRVLWIYLSGYLLAGIVLAVIAGLVFFVTMGVLVGTAENFGTGHFDPDILFEGNHPFLIAIGVATYFTVFLLWSVLIQAFVTMPIMRHYTSVLELHGADNIHSIRQRPRDEHIEAEGFAEALDVGASI